MRDLYVQMKVRAGEGPWVGGWVVGGGQPAAGAPRRGSAAVAPSPRRPSPPPPPSHTLDPHHAAQDRIAEDGTPPPERLHAEKVGSP